jgi:hypothetical protein
MAHELESARCGRRNRCDDFVHRNISVSVAEERSREALPRKRRARGPGFPSESTIQNVVAHPDSARNRWSTNATQTDLRLHFSMELIDVFVGFVS